MYGRPLALAFLLGAPAARDLRVGEHRCGHDRDAGLARLVGVHEVVPHDPDLGVGHVLELEVVGHVAERPDAGHARSAVGVVGPQVPVLVGARVRPRRTSRRSVFGRRPVATSSFAATTSAGPSGGEQASRTPSRWRRPAARWRSAAGRTCWPKAVVNALLMSVSAGEQGGPRSTIVIRLPSAPNTWPISAAMNPPPRITIEPGSSGSRITCPRCDTGRRPGPARRGSSAGSRWPARCCRARSVSSPTRSSFGPMNRACPM